MLIDWVKITPNPNAHDVYVPESFPNAGWSLSYPPTTALFDDFTAAQLDPCVWKIAKTQWGGTNVNGGVIPQNVELCDGLLKLHANGDLYTGPLRGINKDGSQRADGKRTGAGLVTNQYYASGSYETRLKIAPHYGVSSAIWTFYYFEDYSHPVPQFVNHEIDIEMPGRPGSDYTGISFDWALLNTWTGLLPNQYTIGYHNIGTPQDDGQFHTYRIDWHTGDVNQPARVEFYIDGVGQQITTTTIPTRASRFWIGAWFPDQWAGDPNFDTTELDIDWVRITPFHEAGDQYIEESYPYSGWAAASEYPFGCVP